MEEEAYVFRFGLALQVGFDGFVLLVELREVGHEILDDVGVWEGINPGFVLGIGWDTTLTPSSADKNLVTFGKDILTQTSQCIHAVDIHGTTPTNTLSATAAESQGRIHLVLDPDQRIQHHRSRLIQIQSV